MIFIIKAANGLFVDIGAARSQEDRVRAIEPGWCGFWQDMLVLGEVDTGPVGDEQFLEDLYRRLGHVRAGRGGRFLLTDEVKAFISELTGDAPPMARWSIASSRWYRRVDGDAEEVDP